MDRGLIGLGLLFGLAALARSEAIWLGLAWLLILWRGLEPGGEASPGGGDEESAQRAGAGDATPRGAAGANSAAAGTTLGTTLDATRTAARRCSRLRMAAVPAVVAAVVYAPWALRDWASFGTPLPGQTIGNALYTTGFDLFAWSDPPTLARYLAQGPAAILSEHLAGLVHDLVSVLAIPAFPLAPLGIIVLPRVWRLRSLRPLVISATTTFAVTTLAFPVATQSGTFLHAAGPAFILLTISSLAALDAFIAAIGRIRHWTRPVAWLGPAFAIASIAPLSLVSVTSLAQSSRDWGATWESLPAAMAAAGVPLDGSSPVITNYPIWLAESARIPTLALPDESAASVLDLAHHFGAQVIVLRLDEERTWPGVLESGGAAASCFREVPLMDPGAGNGSGGSPLQQIRVYRIFCP